MLRLQFLCQSRKTRAHLRRVQLRKPRRTLRHMWEPGCDRCLLLSRVCSAGKVPGWMSQDCQSRRHPNGPLLRTQKIWIQKEVIWIQKEVMIKL